MDKEWSGTPSDFEPSRPATQCLKASPNADELGAVQGHPSASLACFTLPLELLQRFRCLLFYDSVNHFARHPHHGFDSTADQRFWFLRLAGRDTFSFFGHRLPNGISTFLGQYPSLICCCTQKSLAEGRISHPHNVFICLLAIVLQDELAIVGQTEVHHEILEG